jgi:ribosomal protein L7Ae-like RNA K-turn-binding protein
LSGIPAGDEERIKRALSLLGLARRAGELAVGQDRVFRAAASGRGCFVITSSDCSANVLRKISAGPAETRQLAGVTRAELGAALGVANAQVAALPSGSGFVKKLRELLSQGGTANE